MVRDTIGPNIKSRSACSVLKAPQESKDNRDLKIRYGGVLLRRHDVKRELIPTRPIRQMLANFSGAEF